MRKTLWAKVGDTFTGIGKAAWIANGISAAWAAVCNVVKYIYRGVDFLGNAQTVKHEVERWAEWKAWIITMMMSPISSAWPAVVLVLGFAVIFIQAWMNSGGRPGEISTAAPSHPETKRADPPPWTPRALGVLERGMNRSQALPPHGLRDSAPRQAPLSEAALRLIDGTAERGEIWIRRYEMALRRAVCIPGGSGGYSNFEGAIRLHWANFNELRKEIVEVFRKIRTARGGT